MQRAQEELANLEVTGNAGGGMVSVTLTGAKAVSYTHLDVYKRQDQQSCIARGKPVSGSPAG